MIKAVLFLLIFIGLVNCAPPSSDSSNLDPSPQQLDPQQQNLFPTPVAEEKILLVSDIDDTIKLANAVSWSGALYYFRDEDSAFLGMNHLYQLFLQDHPQTQIVYLSRAPEWLMRETHEDFLRQNHFPQGTYIGRTTASSDEHKLLALRKLLTEQKPDKVLLIGDNGEQDAQTYQQIVTEFARVKIQFFQYIHIVYANKSELQSPQQTGFVTAIELAQDLFQKGLLQPQSRDRMVNEDLPLVLAEKPGGSRGILSFPSFMHCQKILWTWNLPGLNEKIKKVCQ